MIQISCVLCFLTLWSLNPTSSAPAPVDKMSPFLRSMIGTKAIKSGDIPSYSTKPAHVIQTSPVTKRDADSDVLHYMIQTADEIMNITLYPNRKLLSRNFVVQQRTENGSLETMDAPARNCYYTGSVADHQFSKVAFSKCDDEMKGIIEMDDDILVMEPADDRKKDHSHFAHKIKQNPMKFEDSSAKMLDENISDLDTSEEESNGRKKRQSSSSTKTIELMVYVDAGVQNDASQNGFSVVEYILGIVNIMAKLYQDSTLQHKIDLTLTRLILEDTNGVGSINITQDVDSTLDTFCSYQQSINTPDDSNPLHFDHAILITSVDLCQNNRDGDCSTGVIGYAPVGGMCSQSRSCTINENIGFNTAFILAHETGHNLGMRHDGTYHGCGNPQRIMAASYNAKGESFMWSSCSAEYLNKFLSSGKGVCLEDVPAEQEFDVNATRLVGLDFNADKQCKVQFGPTAVFCPLSFAIKEVCSQLWCQVNNRLPCETKNRPALDGTSCGSTNICVQEQCINGSGIVTPVNGGWSEFGPYGSCSRTCGGGVRYRERQCNNPAPAFGGSACPGNAREYDSRLCNTNECPKGTPSFRNQQCAATNNRTYHGNRYSWRAHTRLVLGVTACELLCISAEQNIPNVREPVAKDGTPCKLPNSPNAICVQGTCTPVGCDDVLESGAKIDRCSICNGHDKTATRVSNTLTVSGGFGYHTVTKIPAGAHNVRIAKATPTLYVYLALQSQGQGVLNTDYNLRSPSSFTAIRNKFRYVRNSKKEFVSTPGPLQQELTVKALIAMNGRYKFKVDYTLCDSSSS